MTTGPVVYRPYGDYLVCVLPANEANGVLPTRRLNPAEINSN